MTEKRDTDTGRTNGKYEMPIFRLNEQIISLGLTLEHKVWAKSFIRDMKREISQHKKAIKLLKEKTK